MAEINWPILRRSNLLRAQSLSPLIGEDMVVLVHLSDIHFRKNSNSVTDIDKDLRNEIEADAGRVAGDLGAPTAILVGGDIAFSGARDEYESAKEWLHKFCASVGVTFANVWCVPGNHDVDQNVIKKSEVLFDLQRALQAVAPNGIDAKFTKYFEDEIGRVQLYRSIEEFNLFSENYGYALSAERPFSTIDLELNDRSTLRVFGLNSTVASNHTDNVVKKVVLGRYQLPKSEAGVTNLVLCHHPPDWWIDHDNLKRDVNSRAHIQLYGHKHNQHVQRVENSVQVFAGAMHPDREEKEWRPRYNWITLEVSGEPTARVLNVKIFPRVLSEAEPKFVADTIACNELNHKSYILPLQDWSLPVESATTDVATGNVEDSMDPPSKLTDPVRILTFRLFELSYLTRYDLARNLDLLRNEDEGLRDYDVFKNVLRRATDEDKLADLWDAVQRIDDDARYNSNPFRT
jgi:predicted phosphodiesterase